MHNLCTLPNGAINNNLFLNVWIIRASVVIIILFIAWPDNKNEQFHYSRFATNGTSSDMGIL